MLNRISLFLKWRLILCNNSAIILVHFQLLYLLLYDDDLDSSVYQYLQYQCWSVDADCTPCLKKTVQNCFCQNFVKFPPILIIFGREMAKGLKLCDMHSFSTSPILRHHTTVLNADVPNCLATQRWKLLSAINFLTTQLAHSKLKCGDLFSRIISSYNSLGQNCGRICVWIA